MQTLVSRAAAFLSYLRLQHFRSLSRVVCKFLSPQLCKISKKSSSSAKSAFDFLRLAGELAEIVAASGVNFLETVAAGAEFCFSSESSASISERSARQFQVVIETPHRSRSALIFYFSEPMQFSLLSQKVLYRSRSARSVSSCDRSSTNSCLSEALVLELPKSVCNPIFRVA